MRRRSGQRRVGASFQRDEAAHYISGTVLMYAAIAAAVTAAASSTRYSANAMARAVQVVGRHRAA